MKKLEFYIYRTVPHYIRCNDTYDEIMHLVGYINNGIGLIYAELRSVNRDNFRYRPVGT